MGIGWVGRRARTGRRRWVEDVIGHPGEDSEVGEVAGEEAVVGTEDTGLARIRGRGAGRRAEAVRGHLIAGRFHGHRLLDAEVAGASHRRGIGDGVDEVVMPVEVAEGVRATARMEAGARETAAGVGIADEERWHSVLQIKCTFKFCSKRASSPGIISL